MSSKFKNHQEANKLIKKSNANFIKGGILGFISLLCFAKVLLKLLNKYYPDIDLYKYPFIVEIWGTVADWVMIIVTATTAVLLILSFRAQKKANDISYKNYLLSIKPEFSIKNEIQKIGNGIGHLIELELHKNTVYQYEVINYNSIYVEDPASHSQGDTMFPGGKQFLVLTNEIKKITGDNAENHFIAEIAFTDTDRNYYKQVIFTTIVNTVYITGPERIELV